MSALAGKERPRCHVLKIDLPYHRVHTHTERVSKCHAMIIQRLQQREPEDQVISSRNLATVK